MLRTPCKLVGDVVAQVQKGTAHISSAWNITVWLETGAHGQRHS